MKRIVNCFCIVIMILCCGAFYACGGVEHLTESERKFIGTWILEDIAYFESGKTQLWYPSNSNTFNALCEQYLDKTKIIFEDIKKDGKMKGTLVVGSKETRFEWYGDKSPMVINFSKNLSFSTYNGSTIVKGSTNIAMENTKGKLCINLNHNMIYIFEKA